MRMASSEDLSGTPGSSRCAVEREDGWEAALALRFARRQARTILAERSQRGPLLVQRPFHPEGDAVCHTYVIHPPAGIVGGDRIEMNAAVDSGAHALLTTPSATRWYFSRGRTARVRQHVRIAPGGTLEWLPQETLLFDGAHARLATRIDLQQGSRFCGWEIVGLGRPACNEAFVNGHVDFRFEIYRDGRPLLLERVRSGEHGVPGLRDHTAWATLLATGADDGVLALARETLAPMTDALCGVTRIGDLLVARGLARHCQPLTAAMVALWSALRPSLLGRNAIPPRIWRT